MKKVLLTLGLAILLFTGSAAMAAPAAYRSSPENRQILEAFVAAAKGQ